MNEKVQKILQDRRFQIGAAAFLGVVVGGVAGAKLTAQKLENRYTEALDIEVADIKAFYAAKSALDKGDPIAMAKKYMGDVELKEDDDMESFETKLQEAAHALTEYQGSMERPMTDEDKKQVLEAALADEEPEEEVQEVTHHNIFVNGQPLNDADFDFAGEAENRKSGRPYIITMEEYFDNENGWEQSNLVYWRGDNQLVDERDVPISGRIDDLVGKENLTKFGYGSQDPNVLYIRNERFEGEYEIVLSRGKYSQEVLGVDAEDHLAHSSSRHRIPRMRQDD